MKKLLCVLLCATLLFCLCMPAYAAAPAIASDAAILIDATTGQILYEKNAYKTKYPASVTKILTGLIAIENAPLDTVLTVNATAVANVGGTSHIALSEGEQITLEQALYALSIESANDAANVIGENLAYLSPDGNFMTLMNERAKQAGAQGSNFMNASGLDDDNHYTTCYDIAMIARECIKYDIFCKIFSASTYSMPATNTHSARVFNSSNWYTNGTRECEGLLFTKIGWTSIAHHTMVTVAQRGDTTLIAVVMDSISREQKWNDTDRLFSWGFSTYKSVSVGADYMLKYAPFNIDCGEQSKLYIKGGELVCDSVSVLLSADSSINNVKVAYSAPKLSSDLSTATVDVTLYTGDINGPIVLASTSATAPVHEHSKGALAAPATKSPVVNMLSCYIFGILTFVAVMLIDILKRGRYY